MYAAFWETSRLKCEFCQTRQLLSIWRGMWQITFIDKFGNILPCWQKFSFHLVTLPLLSTIISQRVIVNGFEKKAVSSMNTRDRAIINSKTLIDEAYNDFSIENQTIVVYPLSSTNLIIFMLTAKKNFREVFRM